MKANYNCRYTLQPWTVADWWFGPCTTMFSYIHRASTKILPSWVLNATSSSLILSHATSFSNFTICWLFSIEGNAHIVCNCGLVAITTGTLYLNQQYPHSHLCLSHNPIRFQHQYTSSTCTRVADQLWWTHFLSSACIRMLNSDVRKRTICNRNGDWGTREDTIHW